MADLNPLTYGEVTGRFVAIVGDTGDALEYPDYTPLVGTVTLTADIDYALVINALPVPTTILPRPIVITLNANGEIEWNGNVGVFLVATDDPNTNPTGFTYTASFDLTLDGVAIPYGPFSFQLPGGTAIDLTTVAPVASGGGVLTTAGPPGPSGSALPVASDAEAQAMTLDTKTITPLRLGAASATAATPDRLVKRDASGRAKVATPSASDDIVNKAYVDALGVIKDYGTGTTQIDAVTTNEMGWVQINDVYSSIYPAGPVNGTSVKALVISRLADYGGDGEFALDAELFQTFHGVVDDSPMPYGYVFMRRRYRTGGVWGAFEPWIAADTNWVPPTGGSNETMFATSQDFTAGFASPEGQWRKGATYRNQYEVFDTSMNDPVPLKTYADLGDILGLGLESGAVHAQDNAVPTSHGTVPAATITGTGTVFDMTSRTGSDRATRFCRYDYLAAAASTTAVAGVTYPLALTIENGFAIRVRFAVTGGITTATRLFAGLIDSATMSDVEPSTMLSCFGIGYNSADANFKWYSNDATAAVANAVDTSIPVNTTPSQIVDLIIWCEPGGLINATVRINTAGTITYHQFSGVGGGSYVPASTSPLFLMLKASAGGTSAQPRISLLNFQYATGLF